MSLIALTTRQGRSRLMCVAGGSSYRSVTKKRMASGIAWAIQGNAKPRRDLSLVERTQASQPGIDDRSFISQNQSLPRWAARAKTDQKALGSSCRGVVADEFTVDATTAATEIARATITESVNSL
jgi:hypothetical protein